MFRVILQGIDDVVVGRVADASEQAEYLWQLLLEDGLRS